VNVNVNVKGEDWKGRITNWILVIGG
jgi:hypothetical protein